MIAAVLVFVAFYLSGMNVRIAVCLLGERDHVSMWVYLSVALGASALLILGGVAFGAAVIAQDVLVTGLALISLVSLFVLALNPSCEAAGNPTRAEGSAVVVACTRDERRAHDASRSAALVRRRPCPHRPVKPTC